MRRRAKPILGVDIDNVLAQSDACVRAMFQELYGITLEGQQMPRYDYMTYGVTEEQLVQVFRVFNVRKCRTLKSCPAPRPRSSAWRDATRSAWSPAATRSPRLAQNTGSTPRVCPTISSTSTTTSTRSASPTTPSSRTGTSIDRKSVV